MGLLVLGACVPLVVFPPWALAQVPEVSPPPPASGLVEVTATRAPENPRVVGQAITVLSARELSDLDAHDLGDALSTVAGLDIPRGADRGPASFALAILGLRTVDGSLLVVDGVPWGGSFSPDLGTVRLTDLDRIEVLRGPAPVFFGPTFFVGVIQLVHKDTFPDFVTGFLGSYGSGGGAASYRIPGSRFEQSVEVDGERQGFRSAGTDDSILHALYRGARHFSENTLRLDVDLTWLDQSPGSPKPLDPSGVSPIVPVDSNLNPAGAFQNERKVAVQVGFDHGQGPLIWSTRLSLAHTSEDLFQGFLVSLDQDVFPDASGFRNTISSSDVFFDTHWTYSPSREWMVIGGLDHLYGLGTAHGGGFPYLVNLNGADAPTSGELPQETATAVQDHRAFSGLYFSSEWNPTKAWRFSAGVRVNRVSESRSASTTELALGPYSAFGSASQTHWRGSGSAGAEFLAIDKGMSDLRLFLDYRNTFKPAPIDFNVASNFEILDPERAAYYEVGAKGRAFGGRLDYGLTGFVEDLTDLVIPQSVNFLPVLANAGASRLKGIEGDLSYRCKGPILARISYSYHDARYVSDVTTDATGFLPTDFSGNEIPMSPYALASAGVLYSPEKGLNGGLELNYVGVRFLDSANLLRADPFALVGAHVGYKSGRWEFVLHASNLGDRRDPVSLSELGEGQVYLMPARSVRGSVKMAF
jgi:iron complex outermembrane receptor protein